MLTKGFPFAASRFREQLVALDPFGDQTQMFPSTKQEHISCVTGEVSPVAPKRCPSRSGAISRPGLKMQWSGAEAAAFRAIIDDEISGQGRGEVCSMLPNLFAIACGRCCLCAIVR